MWLVRHKVRASDSSMSGLCYYSLSTRPVVPTFGSSTPGGARWTGYGYVKIILVVAENTEKIKELK
jgi:hypothetical protein